MNKHAGHNAGKLKVGEAVIVRAEAFPGQNFAGKLRSSKSGKVTKAKWGCWQKRKDRITKV